jgi:dTDP-4-amino-4,6-dideoxygalactose transaminase
MRKIQIGNSLFISFGKKINKNSNKKIKLMEDSIEKEELSAIYRCLKSGEYTQGRYVDEFERRFARWNGSKYSIMVNSGSSANLLIIAALKEKYKLKEGDEILVPNVTWPTTIYPVIQNGLVPVVCDVDESYAIDLKSIKKMVNKKTKAIFAVHLLGQPAKINEIKEFCDQNNLILIEDCCESMGAKLGGKKVGTFGEMGSFSLYFGHHITCFEGGIITTDDFETYDLLKSLRSHGWVRGTQREKNYADFKNQDYVFDVLGYNLRNTNVNASVGLVQLKRLDGFIQKRIRNHRYFLEKIKNLPLIPQKINFDETSSFAFGIILPNNEIRDLLLEELQKKGIECRPIVTGNLLRQPVFKNLNLKKDSQKMADIIHERGLYLPNNQFINFKKIDYMIWRIKELLISNLSNEINKNHKKQ